VGQKLTGIPGNVNEGGFRFSVSCSVKKLIIIPNSKMDLLTAKKISITLLKITG
jgi:hypothetical protein